MGHRASLCKRGPHAAYISWEEFEENQKRLKLNQQACALERQSGPPREGPALLQGLIICGKCGRRMTLCYHHRGGRLRDEQLGPFFQQALHPAASHAVEKD